MTVRHNPQTDAFNAAVDHLLTISPEEIKRRMQAHREEANKNPNKRGPKPIAVKAKRRKLA